jgi:UDP-3-O-[3-hydroxymyristoyl] glucosamine N-acyltransferase
MKVAISDILALLDATGIEYVFRGDRNAEVDSVSALDKYIEGTMTWRSEKKNQHIRKKNIRLLFARVETETEAENIIITNNPRQAFFIASNDLFASPQRGSSVGEGSFISETTRLGSNVAIGNHCTIEGDISIGDGTHIGDNVTIKNKVIIGANCEIHSGVVIGHDGFGSIEDGGKNTMIRSFGGVEIGDNVLLGANTVVARGTLNNNTAIGADTKVDALCHIAHNVVLGENVSIVAGTNIFGSTVVEDGAYLSAPTIINNARIGKGAFVGIGSVVIGDVDAGARVFGCPATKITTSLR